MKDNLVGRAWHNNTLETYEPNEPFRIAAPSLCPPYGTVFLIEYRGRWLAAECNDSGSSRVGIDTSEAGFKLLSPSGTLSEGRLRNARIWRIIIPPPPEP